MDVPREIAGSGRVGWRATPRVDITPARIRRLRRVILICRFAFNCPPPARAGKRAGKGALILVSFARPLGCGRGVCDCGDMRIRSGGQGRVG
jgi:hypothetical protein